MWYQQRLSRPYVAAGPLGFYAMWPDHRGFGVCRAQKVEAEEDLDFICGILNTCPQQQLGTISGC